MEIYNRLPEGMRDEMVLLRKLATIHDGCGPIVLLCSTVSKHVKKLCETVPQIRKSLHRATIWSLLE